MKFSLVLAAMSLTAAAAPAPQYDQWEAWIRWYKSYLSSATTAATTTTNAPFTFSTTTAVTTTTTRPVITTTSSTTTPVATTTTSTTPAAITTTTSTTSKSTTTTTTTTKSTTTTLKTTTKATTSSTTTTTTRPTTSPTTSAVPTTSRVPEASSSTATTSTWSRPATSVQPNKGKVTHVLSGKYEDDVLLVHNIHRANHSAPALTWNTTLVAAAKELADQCNFHHDTSLGGGGYGQNLIGGVNYRDTAKGISNSLYVNEAPNYPLPYGNNNPDMSKFGGWGHYSQLVWASTRSVGCYTTDCTSNPKSDKPGTMTSYSMVCNYYPPGNWGGRYSEVHAPGDAPWTVFVRPDEA